MTTHTVTGFTRINKQTFVNLSNGQGVKMSREDILHCNIHLQDTVQITPAGKLIVDLAKRIQYAAPYTLH